MVRLVSPGLAWSRTECGQSERGPYGRVRGAAGRGGATSPCCRSPNTVSPVRIARCARPGFLRETSLLWDDVRLLVDLLDTVLREKGGDALLRRVEAARRAAIRHRDGEAGAEEELRVAVGGLEPAEALPTMRAFSLFFGLVNMAERIHRVRRLREAERPGQGPPRGSIESVVAGLAADAVPERAVVEVLRRLSVVPVFTAHPTEATRLAILVKEQRLARALVDRIERPDPTPPEEEALLARIGEEVRATWETEEHLDSKVVADEVEHVAFYLRRVVYRVLPRLHEALESALTRHYGPEVARTADRPFLRFGSWVGGDMDGNPAVGPDTIIATLVRQRELILGCYVAEVDDLAGRLTQSPTRTGIAPEVLQRIERAWRKGCRKPPQRSEIGTGTCRTDAC